MLLTQPRQAAGTVADGARESVAGVVATDMGALGGGGGGNDGSADVVVFVVAAEKEFDVSGSKEGGLNAPLADDMAAAACCGADSSG